MEEEQLLNEVQEELRREKIGRFIRRALPFFTIALVIFAIAGVFFWKANKATQEAQAAKGDALLQALDLLSEKREKEARVILETSPQLHATSDTIYAVLSRFALASSYAGEKGAGPRAKAVALFRENTEDPQVPDSFRALALLYALSLSLETETAPAIVEEVEKLLTPGSFLFQPARELKAFALWKTGRLAEALQLFTEIALDSESTFTLRSRAEMMRAFLTPRVLPPESAENLEEK